MKRNLVGKMIPLQPLSGGSSHYGRGGKWQTRIGALKENSMKD